MTGAVSPERLRAACADIRARMDHRPDGLWRGWGFPAIRADGRMVGDCEDHALAVLRALYGGETEALEALRSGEAQMWTCRTEGGARHAFAAVRVTVDGGEELWATDNNTGGWTAPFDIFVRGVRVRDCRPRAWWEVRLRLWVGALLRGVWGRRP